jgi:hypothetical protein
MLRLRRRRLKVVLMFRGQLGTGGVCLDTALPAVEANAIDRHVVDDGPVIYVCDVDRTHIHNCAIVEEASTAPVTTLKTNTSVSEPVVDTAVKADVRPPVSGVPKVHSTDPPPISRRPEHPRLRRQHPRAGNPVIAVVAPSPITGRPDIPRSWKRRLDIHRKYGRRERDRYAYGNASLGYSGEHREGD